MRLQVVLNLATARVNILTLLKIDCASMAILSRLLIQISRPVKFSSIVAEGSDHYNRLLLLKIQPKNTMKFGLFRRFFYQKGV